MDWSLRILPMLALIAMMMTSASASNGSQSFSVMTWNIWRGGRETGKTSGPQNVVDVIRKSGADIVAMQETYGSGEIISRALKFKFHPRGTNVSLHSRYPIVEDISVFEEFKCVGALIELPNRSRIAVFSLWLPYDKEIWEAGTRTSHEPNYLLEACQSSGRDIRLILDAVQKRLAGPKYKGVPIIFAGDYNSMSHLDYSAVATDQYKSVVEWPATSVMAQAGFVDAYRELNPVVNRLKDRTWSPKFPAQEQDRIDYIFYRGAGLRATSSSMIDSHEKMFPSDHAAVLAKFTLAKPQSLPKTIKSRIVSYNIKHGQGNDGKLDLDRTAAVLKNLKPDIVGLQEIDHLVARSNKVNQMSELGRKLKMHAAFGAFMPYQGGEYGMGVLSKYPIRKVLPFRLPDGNEPRIALIVEVQLPSGEPLTIVNVHFDWVGDDTFRFAQATALAQFLKGLKTPYVLLGDFNDEPGSRTIDLFRSLAFEAKKPPSDRLTFSSDDPKIEIDFIFAHPWDRWSVNGVKVISEPVASDHRPVVAEMLLKGSK